MTTTATQKTFSVESAFMGENETAQTLIGASRTTVVIGLESAYQAAEGMFICLTPDDADKFADAIKRNAATVRAGG